MTTQATRPPPAVFLDFDGVLFDHDALPREYIRLLGDVLAPALGGTPQAWGEANRVVFPPIWAGHGQWFTDDPVENFRRESILVLRGMCDHLGIDAPPDEQCVRLGRQMHIYVRGNSRAIFPESAGVLRALAERFDVHFATGNPSYGIAAAVAQMDVASVVGLHCGPDLLGVQKRSDAFYPALFERAAVDAAAAVVVDDDAGQLALATAAGARTALVAKRPVQGFDAHITHIAQLPDAMSALRG